MSLSLSLSLSFFLVMSCFLITLIKCLKGRKCLGCLCVFQNQNVTISDSVTYRIMMILMMIFFMKLCVGGYYTHFSFS